MIWNIVIVLVLMTASGDETTIIHFEDARVFQSREACGAGLSDIDLKSYSVEAIVGTKIPWRFEAYCEVKI